VACLTLSKKPVPVDPAEYPADALLGEVKREFDEAQSICRRYRRHDEIGTPLCGTIDVDSLDDNAVTIRYRDTMSQDRVSVERLAEALRSALAG